jgi:hypothetical protein
VPIRNRPRAVAKEVGLDRRRRVPVLGRRPGQHPDQHRRGPRDLPGVRPAGALAPKRLVSGVRGRRERQFLLAAVTSRAAHEGKWRPRPKNKETPMNMTDQKCAYCRGPLESGDDSWCVECGDYLKVACASCHLCEECCRCDNCEECGRVAEVCCCGLCDECCQGACEDCGACGPCEECGRWEELCCCGLCEECCQGACEGQGY